jgi:hypothetical protein
MILSHAKSARQQAVEALQEHRNARPVLSEVYSDDATPEAVKQRLIEQGGAYALLSAESAFLSIVGGRYGKEPNLDTILNGHAADELKTSRVGKRTERTQRACLTLCLMLQPHVMQKLGTVEGFGDRGAAARLLPAFPADFIGSRRIHTRAVAPTLVKAWETVIRRVLDVERNGTPGLLNLTLEALQVFDAYRAALEPTIKAEGPHMAEWLAKLAGAVLRIAGLVHIATWECPDVHPIDAATIRRAITIGTYFHHHARIMLRMMHGRQGQSDAASILDILRTVEADRITRRDLWQRVKNRSGFERDDLDGALDTLEEHGWIRREVIPANPGKAPGGRRSEIIHLNPAMQSQNSQNDQPAGRRGSFEGFENALQIGSAPQNIASIAHAPLQPTGTDGAWSAGDDDDGEVF